MRTTKAQVRHYAELAGVKLQTNSPGDGTIRYRFTTNSKEYLCLGAYAAIKWLEGYKAHEDFIRDFLGHIPESNVKG